MPEFEDKIRSSLDGLSLEPSAPVWDAVSGRIRTRRRRWIFYWLPVAVLVAGLAWWRMAEPSSGGRGKMEGATNEVAVGASNGAGPVAGRPLGGNAVAGIPGRKKIDQITTDSIAMKKMPGSARAGNSSGAKTVATGITGAIGSTPGADRGVPDATKSAREATVSTPDAITSMPDADGSATQATKSAPDAITSMPGSTGATGSLTALIPQLSYSPGQFLDLFASPPAERPPGPSVRLPESQPTETQQPASARRTAPKDGIPRWQTRAYLGGGISAQSRFLKFHAPLGSTTGVNSPGALNVSSNPTGGIVYITASRNPGLGLEAGIEEQYRLARHWKVQAGLDYAHLETVFGDLGKYGTGYTSGNSTGNNVSGAGTPAGYLGGYGRINYVNRYSLFQLPVGVSWLMAPSRKLNPVLFADVSVGYLAGNHILQYDADSLVYHVGSPDLLRHWSGYGRVGFSMDVYHWSHELLYLGPVIEYGLRGIQKQSIVQDHLNYVGFRLGFGF